MAKYRDPEKTHTFGDDFHRDSGPEREESCNAFYNRKQRTKASKLASDCEAEYAERDRDAEADASDVRDKDGFINYKRWDRYGRG